MVETPEGALRLWSGQWEMAAVKIICRGGLGGASASVIQ